MEDSQPNSAAPDTNLNGARRGCLITSGILLGIGLLLMIPSWRMYQMATAFNRSAGDPSPGTFLGRMFIPLLYLGLVMASCNRTIELPMMILLVLASIAAVGAYIVSTGGHPDEVPVTLLVLLGFGLSRIGLFVIERRRARQQAMDVQRTMR